jgi:hypothetical protein
MLAQRRKHDPMRPSVAPSLSSKAVARRLTLGCSHSRAEASVLLADETRSLAEGLPHCSKSSNSTVFFARS